MKKEYHTGRSSFQPLAWQSKPNFVSRQSLHVKKKVDEIESNQTRMRQSYVILSAPDSQYSLISWEILIWFISIYLLFIQ